MLVDDTDSICVLVAGQVRSIDAGAKKTPGGKIIHRYEVCVDATPRPHNNAHADIYARPKRATDEDARPERATGKAYKLLREALAALAVWEEGFAPSDRKGE